MRWLNDIAEKALWVFEFTIMFCVAFATATAFVVGLLVAVKYFRNLWGI